MENHFSGKSVIFCHMFIFPLQGCWAELAGWASSTLCPVYCTVLYCTVLVSKNPFRSDNQISKYLDVSRLQQFSMSHWLVMLLRCVNCKLSLVNSFKVWVRYYNNIIVDWQHTSQVRSLVGGWVDYSKLQNVAYLNTFPSTMFSFLTTFIWVFPFWDSKC